MHEILTCQITKDSDLPREFQRAYVSSRKAGCAQPGPEGRTLEDELGNLASILALPHLLTS